MFLEFLRIAYGLAELTMPGTLSGAVLKDVPDKRMLIALRILGARNVVQGVATLATRGRLGPLGGMVDLTHAASMVGLAAVDARRRRPALLSASTAALFAAGELSGR
ncbi:hypothetical protein [Leifsonia sp. NPDC058248]|uniref:hypothetical protein n=1 Tax=Leifsonia sp. NPDC058248 TaxID=3346402 RepID=UPI0036DB102C